MNRHIDEEKKKKIIFFLETKRNESEKHTVGDVPITLKTKKHKKLKNKKKKHKNK